MLIVRVLIKIVSYNKCGCRNKQGTGSQICLKIKNKK